MFLVLLCLFFVAIEQSNKTFPRAVVSKTLTDFCSSMIIDIHDCVQYYSDDYENFF